jgi:hypothetical protein
MTITAVVVNNGEEMRGDEIEIQAFYGDECRGSAQLQYVEFLDKYIGFLMVHGKGDEMITLKAYDHLTGEEYSVKNAPFRFVADEIVGNPLVPYIIHLGTTGIEELNNSIAVYPNPTTGELRVESGEWRVENVEIFDVMGKEVQSLKFNVQSSEFLNLKPEKFPSFGGAGVVINISSLPSGIYFLRIETENGIVTKKIVKQ